MCQSKVDELFLRFNGIIDQIKKLYSVHMVCVRMHNEAGHDLSEGENYIKDEICNTARDSYHFVGQTL